MGLEIIQASPIATDRHRQYISKRHRRSIRPFSNSSSELNTSSIIEDEELEDFAKVLEQERIDPFETVKGYIRVAQDRAAKLAAAGASEEEIEAWQLEARTWTLVDILFSFRVSPSKPSIELYKFTSNTVAEEQFYRQFKIARESLLVISWLQRTLTVPPTPELRGIKWQFTRGQVKQDRTSFKSILGLNKDNGIVKSLDPDAPLREGRSIHASDAEFDRSLFKYIFQLVQAGEFETAQRVCESTGNFTLNATMNGMVEYRNPAFDVIVLEDDEVADNINNTTARGTQRKALWRRMCLQLARSTQLDQFERALYGFLCGDLDSVLSVSDSWEAQLLAFVQHLSATQVEKFQAGLGRLNISNKDLIAFPQSQADNIGEILNTLSKSPSPKVQAQSQHPLRVIQGGIINSMVPMIVADARLKIDNIRDEVDESNVITDEKYLLRFLAHLILFLGKINQDLGDVNDAVAVLGGYVEELTISGKGRLVPLYVSQLPEDAAIEAYSFLLADISDARERRDQFELAEKYNLDIFNSLRRTIQRVFDEHEDEYPVIESHAEIELATETVPDKRLANSLLWFVDAKMWKDVIESSNALYLRYLLAGKVYSAKQFHAQLQNSHLYHVLSELDDNGHDVVDNVDADDDAGMTNLDEIQVPSAKARSEFQEFEALVKGFASIDEWDHVYAERPADIRRDRTWKLKAKAVVDRVKLELMDLICTWMRSSEADVHAAPDKREAIHRIRVLYVPQLVFELDRVLHQAQHVHKRYGTDALGLVTLVASEELELYKLMIETGRLDEYLISVAAVSLTVGADSENGIWRV
ncbi:nuclear pore protein 84/107 [Lipomyces japonicus]|uniref:nuclear pore protein 84/107 n=1 Tax=Lipomyces japonicus TaxID=56871 RepID=UPI0034CDAA77